jgi:hypothetical protein
MGYIGFLANPAKPLFFFACLCSEMAPEPCALHDFTSKDINTPLFLHVVV